MNIFYTDFPDIFLKTQEYNENKDLELVGIEELKNTVIERNYE